MTENHKAVQSLRGFSTEKLNNLQREDGCSDCGKLKQAERKMVWNCIVGTCSLSNVLQQEMFSLQGEKELLTTKREETCTLNCFQVNVSLLLFLSLTQRQIQDGNSKYQLPLFGPKVQL